MQKYFVSEDIETAETIHADFYNDPEVWENSKDKIFAKAWNYVGDPKALFPGENNVFPFTLLEKYLDEPGILIKDQNQIQCYPNICTHRGFTLVQNPGKFRNLNCAYHGRRFDLDGSMKHMPEFEEVENFPRPCDHLQSIPLSEWANCLFSSINPNIEFSAIKEILDRYLGFFPISTFIKADEYNEDYIVNAHWALYLENYMEGFHIPFVHNGLNSIIDYGKYSTEIFDHVIVQTGFSDGSSLKFELPEGHPNFGEDVTAFYIWAFPNFMINCYPWGVQYNVVKPVTPNMTRVQFIYYIHDQEKFDFMEASKLADKTEREDEFVVEAVHKGVKSRFYTSGRFSVKREKGVHHFQKLISNYLYQ